MSSTRGYRVERDRDWMPNDGTGQYRLYYKQEYCGSYDSIPEAWVAARDFEPS